MRFWPHSSKALKTPLKKTEITHQLLGLRNVENIAGPRALKVFWKALNGFELGLEERKTLFDLLLYAF